MNSIIILKEGDKFIVAEETMRTDITGIEHSIMVRNGILQHEGIKVEIAFLKKENFLSEDEIKRLSDKIDQKVW